MIWDAHIHTLFSGDCETDIADIIQTAIEKNLPGITITDHLDLIYPEDPTLFLLDLEQYDKTIRSLRSHQEEIRVLYGIELGLAEGIEEEYKKITDIYDYDFVIGSSHMVHGKDPYYPEYFAGRTVKRAYEEYFESILENIRCWDGFDVYGHLDYVVRYGSDENNPYDPMDYMDLFDEILKELIARGKGIEANTSGLAYGLSHPHPAPVIIKRYRELGGEILTIGSDAHQYENVGYGFEQIPELLKACGFRYYCLYEKRRPEFIPL
ncbi:MAG: histidinol-phosphatase HisJ family protein [Eubacterium sp.]|nr:histidinol-phosphatase HisJ family protein [Eubacterium sp.]